MSASLLKLPNVHDLVITLHKCRREKDLCSALSLHIHIAESGLDTHRFIGNCLVSMFVDLGNAYYAQHVFEKLPIREEASYNALITGYISYGDPREALTLYQLMKKEDESFLLFISEFSFVPLLKACISTSDLHTGESIHSLLIENGLLERNVFIGSILIHMYAKCGRLPKAQEVFDQLPDRDIVSWTALIGGYAEVHELAQEALRYLESMEFEGITPDSATLVCGLKACSNAGCCAFKVQELHGIIARKGLERNHVLNSALVDSYAKYGMIIETQAVFDKLMFRDVVSWTSLLSGYAEHGRGDQALKCFKHMQDNGISPTDVTYVCTLKACGSIGSIIKGQELHSEISKKGLLENFYVGSALVDMYAKCGSLLNAKVVFDNLLSRNLVSWNALISGYVEHGHNEEVLNFSERMHHEGISPDLVTLVCGLKACASLGGIEKGREMYDNVVKKSLERDIVVGNTLIDMFSKCDCITEAKDVFDKLPARNAVSWTALICGYAEYGYVEEVQYMLNQMQTEGVSPSSATFVCSMKFLETPDNGQGVHCEIVKLGLEKETLVGNTVVDMYAKFGLIVEAEDVLQSLLTRDVVSWNAMMTGLIEHGYFDETLNCFEMMELDGIFPDSITFICGLQACCSKGAIDRGREMHSWIIKLSLSEIDDPFGRTLVDMYGKCGLLEEAQKVFDKFRFRSKGSWNAIIAAYAECEHSEEAIECFDQMQEEGASPDSITIVCVLKACGFSGMVAKGQQIHSEVMLKGLDIEPLVGNTLVFMYAKCSLIEEAQKVFDQLLDKNIISWTALMAGYAQIGKCENVFLIFDKIIGEGMKPDLVTLGSLLNACSHSGLVDKGKTYFDSIVKNHGLALKLEHYVCMIDMLGRAGHVVDAVGMIEKMPFQPGIIAWHIVLGACRKWGNVELGRYSFEEALKLDEDDSSVYLCMFNIYQDAGMHKDAHRIEAMRKAKEVWKNVK